MVLALTAEEEISGQGLSAILSELGPIDAALVGEPTGLTPMTAQRGSAHRHGHVRMAAPVIPPTRRRSPPTTRSPLPLRTSADSREFDWGPAHPLLGRTHAHVTQIHGGIARNVIPDSCEFTLDIRTTPVETHRADLRDGCNRPCKANFAFTANGSCPIETSTDHPDRRGVRCRRPAVRRPEAPR